MGDDLLGLGRVLRAALHEDLFGLVDLSQRYVSLEIEVLLAGELELAPKHVRGLGKRSLDVAALEVPPGALEVARGNRFADRHQRGERLVLHLDGRGAEPGSLQTLSEYPADGVSMKHHLGREQRLVVLHPGVVDPWHVVAGKNPNHPGYVVRRLHPKRGDQSMGVRRLDRPGVQDVARTYDEIVGVESLAGDMQRGTLMRQRQADHGLRRSLGQHAHPRPRFAPGAAEARDALCCLVNSLRSFTRSPLPAQRSRYRTGAATGRASPSGTTHSPGGRPSACPRSP